jgi:hypothetical protein
MSVTIVSMLRHGMVLVGVALAGMVGSCSKKSPSPQATEFDKRWADLAHAGVEVSYIEDDRGEGLMGNVRRASRVKAEPPVAPRIDPAAANPSALPEQLPGDQVHRIIRGNLMAVRGCFMTMVRAGQARSGKAIVSFSIGADGKTSGLRVDAPSFVDTSLPGCVTAQVSHWEFPKSQKGGGQVSYPFVFVGG